MSEFTDELRTKLNNLLYNKIISDKEISKLQEIVKNSTTYEDAYSYAMRYGEHLANAIQELGVETWLFGTAVDTWEPAFKAMVSDINKVCDTIQANKNAIEHIGLKPQSAPYNAYDMREVVQKLTKSPDVGTNIQEYLNSIVDEKKTSGNKYTNAITNYGNKAVDKTQKKNINFLLKSGITIRVTRVYDRVGLHTNRKPIPCIWCLDRAGTALFHSTAEARDSGIFARHDGCGCKIDYDNRKTGTRTTSRSQSVWKDSIENTAQSSKIVASTEATSKGEILTEPKLKARVMNEAINAKEPFYAEDLRQAYKTYGVKPKDGCYDVLIHGASDHVEYEHKYNLDAETLYMIISGRRDYHTEYVRLLSCSTGKVDEKGYCVAQDLANRLGVDVYAPIDTLNINPNGKLTVGDEDLPENLGFKWFSPEA